jgi:hypothetical protein
MITQTKIAFVAALVLGSTPWHSRKTERMRRDVIRRQRHIMIRAATLPVTQIPARGATGHGREELTGPIIDRENGSPARCLTMSPMEIQFPIQTKSHRAPPQFGPHKGVP